MLASVSTAHDPFVGRGAELRRLRTWLADGQRLLTIRGPVGVGKSRLAWELSRSLGDAALYVDACDRSGQDAILRRLARALSLEVTQASAADLQHAVAERLAQRGPTLIVLDNLDPVVPELSDLVARLRSAAPETTFILTAREALRLRGERVLELGPLSVADEAVELLRLRAAGTGADLWEVDPDTLRAIATALDGLPLALELAAAQLPHLPAARLLERLPARLEILVRSPGANLFSRHTTLREAIDAAWRALSPQERDLLAQVTVFRGGFDRVAAEAVVQLQQGDTCACLTSLRERSLLHLRADSGRYFVDESVRTFAARHLDPARRAAVERRHAAFFLARGAAWARALEEKTCLAAADALEREHENLLEIHRRTLGRSSVSTVAAGEALQAALVLAPLYLLRQHARDLVRLLDSALESASPSRTDAVLRGQTLLCRGKARLLDGRPASAMADLLEATGLARVMGDGVLEGRALLELARVHREQGRDDEARRNCDRAIALLRKAGEDAWLGRALGSRGLLAHERGEIEEAHRWFEEAVEAHVRAGDRRSSAITTGIIGNLFFDQGRVDEARARIDEALATFRAIGDGHNEAALLSSLGAIDQEAGDHDGACSEYERSLSLLRHSGRRRLEALITASLASAHLEAGRVEQAREIYERAIASLRELGDPRNLGVTLLQQAMLLLSIDEPGAEALVDRADQLIREVDDPVHSAAVAAARAALCHVRAAALRRQGDAGAELHEEEARRLRDAAYAGKADAFEVGRLLLRLLERTMERTGS